MRRYYGLMLLGLFFLLLLGCSSATEPSDGTYAPAYTWYQGSDGDEMVWCRMEGEEEVCLPPGQLPPPD